MNINADDFKRFFGKDLKKYYGLEIKFAMLLGMITKKDDKYTMTKKGAYYYHFYENHYTLSYIDQMWSLMGRKAFPDELIIK